MKHEVVFLPDALIELDEAYNWYETRSSGLGDRFYNEVQNIVERIRNNPECFQVKYRDVRNGVVNIFPFLIPYLVIEHRIVILSIMHGKRNPEHWKKRRRKMKF